MATRSRNLCQMCLLLAMAFAAACETTKEVASACTDMGCPDQAQALADGPACALGTLSMELIWSAEELTSETFSSAICFPRPLPKADDGTVTCSLRGRLVDSVGNQAAFCNTMGGVETTDSMAQSTCLMPQLSSGEVVDNAEALGWYYDDSSDDVALQCAHGQRLAFTVATMESIEISVQCEYALANADDVASLDDNASVVYVQPQDCATMRHRAGLVEDVGQPCMPMVLPERGPSHNEVLVETASPDCVTGACMVYEVDGAFYPAKDCSNLACASESEVANRVFCTCRCSADEPGDEPLCDCPSGFVCQDILTSGPAAGGYCVRESQIVIESTL